MQKKYKYKLKEANVVKEETIISKLGITVEFTPASIMASLDHAYKQKKELQAQWGVNTATMQNVKNTHPHIAEMSEEDLTAAYLYRQAMGSANECQDKLLELDEAIKEDYYSLLDACKQLELEIIYKAPEGFELPEHLGDEHAPS